MLNRRSVLLVVTTVVLLTITGCGRTTPTQTASEGTAVAKPADPHDMPITEADVDLPKSYAEALSRIESYRDKIRDECGSDVPARAHRPLDELDIVLAKLPTIARDSGVSKEHWETINTTSRKLRDDFKVVHADIDAGKKPDFSQVADAIQTSIDQLRAPTDHDAPATPDSGGAP